MTNVEFETYDFIINDEDEPMLLLYVRDGEPNNATIEIDLNNHSAILHRNDNDHLNIKDISEEIIDSLKDADNLMICEMSIEENEDDTQIVYAYEADITD